MRGHYSNSCTTFFPVTRQGMADFVRRVDAFGPDEVEGASGELWGLVNRYIEKRDMPPMIDSFHRGEEPRIVTFVPSSTVYLSTAFLSVLILTVPSWLLARRYCSQADPSGSC